jgi:hypothetical protein
MISPVPLIFANLFRASSAKIEDRLLPMPVAIEEERGKSRRTEDARVSTVPKAQNVSPFWMLRSSECNISSCRRRTASNAYDALHSRLGRCSSSIEQTSEHSDTSERKH